MNGILIHNLTGRRCTHFEQGNFVGPNFLFDDLNLNSNSLNKNGMRNPVFVFKDQNLGPFYPKQNFTVFWPPRTPYICVRNSV